MGGLYQLMVLFAKAVEEIGRCNLDLAGLHLPSESETKGQLNSDEHLNDNKRIQIVIT